MPLTVCHSDLLGMGFNHRKVLPTLLLFPFIVIFRPLTRAGHVPTFFKSFRFILEWGPSARSFCSHSFSSIISFMFCSVPFCSILSRITIIPLCSVLGKQFHPSCPVLSQESFHPLFHSYSLTWEISIKIFEHPLSHPFLQAPLLRQ